MTESWQASRFNATTNAASSPRSEAASNSFARYVMSNRSSKLSLGGKFALIASTLVLLGLGLLSVLVSVTMTRHLNDQAMSELRSSNRQVRSLA